MFDFREIRAGRLAALALGAAVMWGAGTAGAQTYPERPIRILAGFPSGSAPDILARLIGDKLGETLGQRGVVDNRPGAGGNIASETAAQAAPDGYTLYLVAHPPFTLNPMLYSKTSYDPVRDFEPVALVGSQWFIVSLNAGLPVRTMQELVDYAKARPGQLNYASAGAGSPHHLGIELLKLKLGLDIVHVPFRGASQGLPDVLSGAIPIMFTSINNASAHFQSGKLVALAVTSRARSPAMPDVPTVAETVYPGYEVTAWFGIVAPARTPKEIVATLNREIVAGMRQPDVTARMTALGLDVLASTPQEMAATIAAEIATWKPVIEAGKLKVE
jgi:tripartite-type tricarboxylate transporter receptor subunit TctC